MGSKKRLENELYEEYNAIIEEQLLQGIVEAAPGVPTEMSTTSPTRRW